MSVFLQWKLQVEVVYEESFHCHTTGWFKMLRFHHKWQKDNWSFYNRSFGNWTLDNWSIYNSLNFKQKHWKNDLWQLIFDNWSNSKISSTLLNLYGKGSFLQLNFGQWSIRQLHWTTDPTDPLESASAIQNSKRSLVERFILKKISCLD